MAEQRTTPEQRAALRRLHEGATPEPWGWNSYSGIAAPVPEGHPLEDYEESDPGDRGLAWICWIDGGPRQKGHGDALIVGEARNNAALIEGLRNAAPALLDDADALAGALAEAERYRAALRTIRDHYGQVCDEYETCTHPACAASYGAWAVADEALAGVAPNAPRGVAESALDGPRGPKSTNGPSAPISGATGRNTQGGAE